MILTCDTRSYRSHDLKEEERRSVATDISLAVVDQAHTVSLGLGLADVVCGNHFRPWEFADLVWPEFAVGGERVGIGV